MDGLRVALLGFSIECNRFAPPATEADFRRRSWFEGEAMLAEARAAAPRMMPELPGFVAEMDAAGPWRRRWCGGWRAECAPISRACACRSSRRRRHC